MSPKPFSFSYSRLKNFEVCPRRYHEVDVLKSYKEGESEALSWGNEVHKAAELYLTKGTPLPVGMPVLQNWLDRIKAAAYDKLLVEQQLAITRDFAPAGYWDKNVWFRAKVDILGIVGPVAIVLDLKTGKLLDDSQQLALMAACVFAHFPAVKKIRTEFVWLKEGPDVSTREDFAREDMAYMWANLWPRIETLEHASETKTFPPKPGKLCAKWCVVKSCEHNGRS